MKPKRSFRNLLLLSGSIMLTLSTAHADTLYWDGNDTDANANGGAGTWDNLTTFNWDALPIAGAASQWDNANTIPNPADTAVFGGTAGTVTLGEAIDVGGLQFDTTGYGITSTGFSLDFEAADNTILFNNVAAASVTGPVGGAGNVILTGSNRVTAGTLTLNSSGNGWSGTTTVNTGMTLTLSNNSTALANTGIIAINGGTINLRKNSTTGNNQVSNGAGITFTGGGTYQQGHDTAINSIIETIGPVVVASGQANFVYSNGSSNGGNLTTLTSLTRTGSTSAVTFSNAGNANVNFNVSGADDTAGGQIIGPWATFGSSATAQTDYAIYTGGNGTVAGANIAGTAEDSGSWVSGANVTLNTGSAVALTGTRTVASLKFIGSTSTLTLGDHNLETYGILWGGGNANKNILGTGAGVLTTPGGGGNLFLTVGQNISHTVSATIGNNSGAVTLVKGGSGTLDLTGSSNSHSGGTVLNAGTLRITSDANLGDTVGDITFNGNATLNMNTSAALVFGAGRNIVINEGALATMTSGNGSKTFEGVLEGSGTLYVNHSTSFVFSNTANTFTGSITASTANNLSYGLDMTSLPDDAGNGSINLNNGSFRWFGTGGTKTFDDREFNLAGTTSGGTISNRSGDNSALVIAKDLGVTGVGNKALTLAGTSTGANNFSGDIADGTNGAGSVISLTKNETGTWALSGTNSYSGLTNVLGNGRLIFQGEQSLSPNTTVQLDHTSGSSGKISILSDTSGEINLSTKLQTRTNNASGNHQIFIGNNNTDNGGTSSGTTTGSTFIVPELKFDFIKSDTAYSSVDVSSSDGYTLQIDSVVLNSANARSAGANWQARFNPTGDAIISLGDVSMLSGNALKGIPFLQLEGTTAGNKVTGTISEAPDALTTGRPLSLTKTGASTWTLEGDNTYTGATAINQGTLIINGNTSTAVGAVTVAAAGTIGGIGTVGGNTDLNGTLSPGESPGTLTFAGDLTLGNGATYFFEGGDLTEVQATLGLTATWTLALGMGLQDGGSVTIFNYDTLAGSPNLSPTFNTALLGFTPSDTLTLTDTGSSIVLNGVSFIPEPSTALLGALGAMLLLRRRR